MTITLDWASRKSESFELFDDIKSKLFNWSRISDHSDSSNESEDFFEDPVASSSIVGSEVE